MSAWIVVVLGLTALLVGLVFLSHVVETLRSAPSVPRALGWAPGVPVAFVDVNGIRLRYVVTGEGPPLVLLHTLRTQLDMFQQVIPPLSGHFRVYAADYPGHGYSAIPDVDYTVEFFLEAVAGFLERLNIQSATVVGESIGGSLALLLAARGNPRVRGVIAVNPYDYDRGRGLRRSSPLANLIFGLNDVPMVGATVTRLRSYPIVKKVFEGGVARKESLPPALLREMYWVGNRPGHYRAFMSLMRHAPGWERARSEYSRIHVPVLLIYGSQDWSRVEEREANQRAIPGARLQIVEDAGHFLSLDAPNVLVDAIGEFGAGESRPGVVQHP